MKPIVSNSTDIDDITIYLCLFKMHKSYLLLISDQEEMGIGSVSLGSPPLIEGIKAINSSYSLFGVDKKILSTIITEKATIMLKKPVLLLLFLKTKKDEKELGKGLIEFLNQNLSNIAEYHV